MPVLRLLAVLLLILPFKAWAAPLVDAAWLAATAPAERVVLDLRAQADYERAHIPGAVRTDFAKDGWRVTDRNGVPFMLPEPAQLEALFGGLGIGNGDPVVIAVAGTSAMEFSAATRVYWTFRMAGHDAVSILNGGMAAWTADSMRPLEAGAVKRPPKAYRATMHPELLATKADVAAALGRADIVLVDIRDSDQYLGVTKPPAPKRKGTLPGARNLPENWVTVDNGGTFRSAAALRQLAYVAGLPREGKVITFCNTGQLASLGWFVLHELLGNKDARLYDGSMVEWTMDPATPVELKIEVGN